MENERGDVNDQNFKLLGENLPTEALGCPIEHHRESGSISHNRNIFLQHPGFAFTHKHLLKDKDKLVSDIRQHISATHQKVRILWLGTYFSALRLLFSWDHILLVLTT